jgi:hypothetical protein
MPPPKIAPPTSPPRHVPAIAAPTATSEATTTAVAARRDLSAHQRPNWGLSGVIRRPYLRMDERNPGKRRSKILRKWPTLLRIEDIGLPLLNLAAPRRCDLLMLKVNLLGGRSGREGLRCNDVQSHPTVR